MSIKNIDKALSDTDFQTLMEITELSEYKALPSKEVETSYALCSQAKDDCFVVLCSLA